MIWTQVPEGQWFCADCRPKETRRSERRKRPAGKEEFEDESEEQSEEKEQESKEEDSDEDNETESKSNSEDDSEQSKALLSFVFYLACWFKFSSLGSYPPLIFWNGKSKLEGC